MSKKILAMLMAVAMAFSLLPVTAFATDGPSATTTDDVVYGHYENGENGAWTEGAPTRTDGLDNTVTVNKTAEKVDGQDNQYDVTLKVEMKYKTTEVPPGAAATVLVIDTSGSMEDDTKCSKEEHVHDSTCYTWEACTQENHPLHYVWWKGEYVHIPRSSCKWDGNKYVYQRLICNKEAHKHGKNCETTSRIEAAKVAAKNFLNSYRGGTVSEDGRWTPSTTPLNRYVSIVSFNKYVSKNDWVDVSTKDGYNAAIASINALSADGGTNLDAGLRMANAQLKNDTVKNMPADVVVLTDGKPTYHLEKAENQKKDSGVEIEGVKYSVKGYGHATSEETYDKTVSTATTLKQAASVYTVCFGASNEKLEAKDKPTVSEFLKTNIATQQAEGKTYAYDANDTTDLYKAFAAISSSVVSGLNTGKVTDGLPAGVSCTDNTFGEDRTLTWNLKPNEADVTQEGEYNVYTYTKTYKVNVDPATVKTVEVGGVNYAPLNTPTILTVQHNGSPVQIPFPIPAGKVTYSLTDFNKELVTKSDTLSFDINGFTIPDTKDSTVTVGENGVTLLYKITVKGDKGAKFIVRDDGATLVSPKDDSITFNQEGSTFSGTVGTTGETVFYVSKHFDIDANTKTVSNTATIVPGDNANGPADDEKTKTVTTPAKEPDSQTYTVTYQWADENRPSDATLPTGNPFILNVGQKHTVQPVPTSDVKENNGKAGTWICTWDATSNEIQGNAGEDITIKGTWTFTEDQPTTKWDVSKSKKATNLDSNYESKVTLSIPSSEEQLVSDVLFILDESSCSESVKASVNSMLDELYKQIENSGAKIKVGAVQFRGNVTTLPLTELTDKTKTEITSFMSSRPEVGGTNMSAGLLEAQKMLDNDTSVMDGRKYVILVSDGITYIWDDETTDAQENLGVNFANADLPNRAMLAGPDGWDVKYGKSYIPENWESHFNGIGSMMSTTIQNKASNYERGDNATTGKTFVAYGEKEQYTSTVDIALYKSYNAYKALQKKYNTYAVCSGVEKDMTDFPFGPSFMTYLADGKNVTFDGIQNDILYTVSAGSRVEDYMGYVEGDYNFDFINDASKLSITVGTGENKETLEAAVIGENHYGFEPVKKVQEPEAGQEMTTSEISYRYELKYEPGQKKGDEHFTWRINVPVSNFAPVALTYYVKLMNPKSASGTYGQYDENGSKNYSGLYTNNSATLHPVDSNSKPGVPEDFLKPTVSYTVKGSSGSHSGGSRPSLNTKDHYGYIIGYPVDYYTGQPTTDQTKKPVRPEGKITRAEVATIYFRMLTDESRTKFWSQSSGYSDVKTGDWFNNAVSTLSNAGIIAGYEDGSFRPNGYITRAEFATIAARFFDVTYNGKDLFPDISGHWAKDYINQAANKGFVNGYEDGTFKPDRNITRAEAVTLVNRTLDRHPDKSHFTKDMLVWPDNMDQTKWYYADMQEATNSHTYQMKENSDKTKYENWTKTLPIRNWEALEKAWSNANSSQGNGNVV